jgi:hypothetical protein
MVWHLSPAQKGEYMRYRYTKALVAIAAVGAISVPAVAQASHGSDDPAGHVRREDHRFDRNVRRASDDGPNHHRHGSDDGPNHHRHGSDDGPNHR